MGGNGQITYWSKPSFGPLFDNGKNQEITTSYRIKNTSCNPTFKNRSILCLGKILFVFLQSKTAKEISSHAQRNHFWSTADRTPRRNDRYINRRNGCPRYDMRRATRRDGYWINWRILPALSLSGAIPPHIFRCPLLVLFLDSRKKRKALASGERRVIGSQTGKRDATSISKLSHRWRHWWSSGCCKWGSTRRSWPWPSPSFQPKKIFNI